MLLQPRRPPMPSRCWFPTACATCSVSCVPRHPRFSNQQFHRSRWRFSGFEVRVSVWFSGPTRCHARCSFSVLDGQRKRAPVPVLPHRAWVPPTMEQALGFVSYGLPGDWCVYSRSLDAAHKLACIVFVVVMNASSQPEYNPCSTINMWLQVVFLPYCLVCFQCATQTISWKNRLARCALTMYERTLQHMCNFFAGAGYMLPFFDNYDFYMRLDSDSTCPEGMPDYFQQMESQKADYYFRTTFKEGGMLRFPFIPVFWSLLHSSIPLASACLFVYSCFHTMRLALWISYGH